MNKKSINHKEVKTIIKEKLDQGISRNEILLELSEIYFDKSSLTGLVASYPNPERIIKYKYLNNILLYFLIITIIFKILVGIILFSASSLLLIPLAFLLPIINIYFAFEVSKYKGYIYNLLGILTVAGILRSLGDLQGVYGVLDVMICLFIVLLSFYLGRKMFPNYGLFGVKKNQSGEAILE
jgi:hypothetical protein